MLEVRTDICVNGEPISAWRGLRPWRVDENVRIGTWESQSVSNEAVEKRRKRNDAVSRFGSRTNS